MITEYTQDKGGTKMRRFRKPIVLVALLAILIGCFVNLNYQSALADSSSTNKYNVVVVLDASNSMNYTDPNNYRYEAIGLFINLLTDEGNYIGNVVFSNDVLSKQDIIAADGQQTKNDFINKLKETNATGYTNIGGGIDTAVEMLKEQGDPSLPSVILFLSDGNTEMPDQDQLDASLALKADAIQKAREHDIQIYSVCLNANATADVSEMKQLADATNGHFNEVASPEDLTEVFNDFYNMIYGTSTINIGDEVVPDNGVIEKEFNLPSFGVEEVNIIIYGVVDNVEVLNPVGTLINSTVTKSSTYTIVKFSDISEGKWKLTATGDPGTHIKINMVYNTNLHVGISSNATNGAISNSEDLVVSAVLESNGTTATQDGQYSGYSATLLVMDSYRNVVNEIPMEVKNGCFVSTMKYNPDTYYFKVNVTGNYLNKESEELGPIVVAEAEVVEEVEVKEDKAPTPVKNPVKETIYIIPFKENEHSFDMTELAKDDNDSKLHYEIVSSSFIEGEDYSVDGNNVELTQYSLRKGAFTVRAYDSLGQYCDIEVIITSINVGILTLIIVGIIGLIVLICFGLSLWYWLGRRLRGKVTIRSVCNGTVSAGEVANGCGRIKLRRFHINNIGLDYSKSYIQATGKNFVYLRTNIPVGSGTRDGVTKKFTINDGMSLTIYGPDPNNRLDITFKSNIKKNRSRRNGYGSSRRTCNNPYSYSSRRR